MITLFCVNKHTHKIFHTRVLGVYVGVRIFVKGVTQVQLLNWISYKKYDVTTCYAMHKK